MINLIGDDITIYRNKTFKENEFFYDYLKKQVKAKRKMGHLTIIEKKFYRVCIREILLFVGLFTSLEIS